MADKSPTLEDAGVPDEQIQTLPATTDPDAYLYFDKRDEAQIVQQLQGAYLEEYVYKFKNSQGHEITSISWLGVQEASREYQGIQTKVVDTIRDDKGIEFLIEATDKKTGSSRLGTARQPWKMRTKGGYVNDSFAVPKALSKAQRNAIRQLLPQSLIKEWINNKLGKTTKPRKTAAQKKDAPAAGPGEVSEKQKNYIAQLLKNEGLTDRDAALNRANDILTENGLDPITTQEQLTKKSASVLINALKPAE